jgi:SAM-dependent methyltransferase
MEEPGVKQCCAAFYGSDLARLLLGDSFHPGGTELTGRLGMLLGLTRECHVLDVASGRGTSAFHLAESFGCKVTGLDLSEENVLAAAAEAANRGLHQLVAFQHGDAEMLPFDGDSFDAIVCECAFCTFPGKSIAAQEFYRVLKPGGQVGVSDLTRTIEQIPGLEGLLSWIACIGDALAAERYVAIFEEAGLETQRVEDHKDVLLEMVRQVQTKLFGAEILAGLKKIDLPGVDLKTGRQFAQAALQAVREGNLGYVVITSRKSNC